MRFDGNEHRLRHAERLVLGVDALEDLAHHLGLRQVLGQVENEPPPADHPAPPHEEHLDRGFELVAGEPDHVDVLVAVGDHLLALDRLAHADEAVAHPGRPLVLEMVGRIAHLGLEPPHDLVGVAVEKVEELLDQPVVGVLVDGVDAGTGALLDVKQQAGPTQPVVAVELVVGTGPQREGPQQEVEGLPDGVGMAEWSVVADPLPLAPPHHHRPRPLLVEGDGQERIALVVTEPDVEAGLVLLDQGVLEQQRLDVVADLDPLDGLGVGDHLRRPQGQARRAVEVVGQARPQAVGLAHVDHPALGVLELVGARGVGDRARRRSLHHPRNGTAGPNRDELDASRAAQRRDVVRNAGSARRRSRMAG